jgi:hypothetical protein
LSDDSGLSESNTDDDGSDSVTDDDGSDSVTDDNNDTSNDSTDPTLYYGESGSISGNSSSGNSPGDSFVTTKTITVTKYGDPQNAKIPMQKTGIPFLPAELGIISIIGGFMINRIRS